MARPTMPARVQPPDDLLDVRAWHMIRVVWRTERMLWLPELLAWQNEKGRTWAAETAARFGWRYIGPVEPQPGDGSDKT